MSLSSRFTKVERKLTSVVKTQHAQGARVAGLSKRVSRLDSARRALGLPAPRANPKAKRHVVKIELDRVEGPTSETGKKTATSFGEAQKIIRAWSWTAPKSGYDKTDFRVTYDDTESYSGRLDIRHPDVAGIGGNDLADHMLRALRRHPNQAAAKEFLRLYQIGDVEPARKNPTVMRTASGKPISELGAAVYTARHRWPKRNGTITVIDEPKLMRREFPFTAADHRDAARVFAAKSDEMAGLHGLALQAAYARYGEHGPLISAIGHAGKFPESTKEKLRSLARRASAYRLAAHAHWKASGSRSAMPYGAKGWTYSQLRGNPKFAALTVAQLAAMPTIRSSDYAQLKIETATRRVYYVPAGSHEYDRAHRYDEVKYRGRWVPSGSDGSPELESAG